MQIYFIPKPVGVEHWSAGFTLDRVWARDAERGRDISHLLDRPIWINPRELQWHLAHRFGRAAQAIELTSEA
jgi:hypothetical protein